MKQYLKLAKKILKEGNCKKDRTGVGTISIFGYQMRFNLEKGFPLITTKYCHLRSIIHELIWFLKGDTNINYLVNNNVSIWNKWADDHGNLGPIYGKQWRAWRSYNGCNDIDQIKNIIDQLRNDHNSRRIVVSSWNVGDLDKMKLVPCHLCFQFYVADNKLSCHLYQRSCDVFIGLPFNIASYSLLTHMIAQQCDFQVGEFIWSGGDVHIYNNHLEQICLQLKRKPRSLPKLILKNKPSSIFEYHIKDFEIKGYNPYPKIKASVAV